MAKMINADELIEFCNTERAMLHAHNNSVACAALRRVEEFAKEYAVEAEPVDDWISVKDEMPELYKNVLTIDSEGKIFINWLEDIIEMKGYFAYGGGTITHWQHLPKPPKGE